MTGDQLDKEAMVAALRLVGEKLDWPVEVEVVIVGGAAGMLLGVWPPGRITEDADIVEISPPIQPRDALIRAAHEAAEELDLSPHWLNDDFTAFGTLDTLPDAWRQRAVEIGTFRKLRVVSPGRQDLLAMKVYAGRPQDIEDVYSCLDTLTADDLTFIRGYLESLCAPHRRNIKQDQLEQAFALLRLLEEDVR